MISQHGAILGDTVNMGALIANLAEDDEIILSDDAWQQLSAEHRAMTRKLEKVRLKGSLIIYLALFIQSDITKQFIPPLSGALTASHRLSYIDKKVNLNEPAPGFVIGRHRSRDLIVQQAFVSCKHVTIIGKLGKSFLLDHSSNCSFVSDADEQAVFICRDMVHEEIRFYLTGDRAAYKS